MDELLWFGGETMTHSMMKGPYENHYYRLGSVIRNTVSQAQGLLCDLDWSRYEQGCRDSFHDMGWMGPGLTYPKSLGELCIELAQETLLEGVSVVPAFPGHRVAYIEWTQITDRFPNLEVNISISRRDIQKLRETMYHKHTNPEKERKTAKSERLIELVRNA